MTEKLVEIKDLEISFGEGSKKFVAVKNANFFINKGETFSLVGESGSGKTTIGRAIIGLNDTSAGDIFYEGKKINGKKSKAEEADLIRKIQMIFQDPAASLNERATVDYIISEGLYNYHLFDSEEDRQRKVKNIINEVGLLAEHLTRYPHEFSGGQRQRIVIAIALACRPDILICDEPTTALDVTIQAQIIDLLKSLQQEYHFTTIFITHDLGVVASIADKVAVMYAGEIVEYGTVEEIFYEPKHPYTWSLLSSLPQLADANGALYSIPGTPPSLYSPIKGDAFALRSDYAMSIDFEEEAPAFKVSDTHWAKTWLLHEDAPKVDKPEIIENLHEKIRSKMGFNQLEA